MIAPRCTCADAIARPDPRCPVHSPSASPRQIEAARDQARTRKLEWLIAWAIVIPVTIGLWGWAKVFLGGCA